MYEYVVEMKGISKSFPGTKALDDVALQLKKGEFTPLSVKTEREKALDEYSDWTDFNGYRRNLMEGNRFGFPLLKML